MEHLCNTNGALRRAYSVDRFIPGFYPFANALPWMRHFDPRQRQFSKYTLL